MIDRDQLLAARAQVRAYCWERNLNGANTAACVRQLEVLLANGNTRDFAQRHAEALADRISDRLNAAAQATNAAQPGAA